ncbi:MAG: hypothetical protein K2Q33_02995, partial [Gammaproteobacteria bacterium]|nr:hypothetical protein [Gammaproteobacteria bacterium]
MSDYSLADFLPYKKDKIIISAKEELILLKVIIFFCNLIVKALHAFEERKYTCFDAHVGENLCQIRAYQLIQYSKIEPRYYKKIFSNTELEAVRIKNQASNMLLKRDVSSGKRYDKKSESLYLIDFLFSNSLICAFQELEYFLIQAYVLSRYKYVKTVEYKISYYTDYSFLREIGMKSNSQAIKMIHKMQRNISKLSCEFINNLAVEMKEPKEYISLIRNLYFTDEVGRHLISCYEATRTMLSHAYLMKETVKIQVIQVLKNNTKEIEFFLELFTENVYFAPKNRYNYLCFIGLVHYMDEHSESSMEYIRRFLKAGFKEIILANMAQHAQFAGKLLSDKKENPYMQILEKDRQFSTYKRKAEEC